MEAKEILEALTEAYAQRDLLNMDQAKALDAAIPDEVKKAMEDVANEFAPKHDTINAKIAELEVQAKEAVLVAGETCKGGALQAVYSKPRITWDTKQLEGLMIVLPELEQARKEGQPTVSIRRTG